MSKFVAKSDVEGDVLTLTVAKRTLPGQVKNAKLIAYKTKGDSVFVAGKLIGTVRYIDEKAVWESILIKENKQHLFIGVSNHKHAAVERVVKGFTENWTRHGGGR